MSEVFKSFNLKLAEILKSGGVGVIPTDTIYGIVGSALNKKTVEHIYKLRKRDFKKPMIILISSVDDLKLFGINIGLQTKIILSKIWPGKVSVILPCPSDLPVRSPAKEGALCEGGPCKNNKFSYLHRGANSLAFRFPKNKKLINFIKKTGPLVAPSANWEGYKPAKTIKEAAKYFKSRIEFYIDLGTKKSLPSTLIEINRGKVALIREGAVSINAYL
ncbi:MAG: L-threonylcarbamoyladenylate synthase [bacterium]|nr:L-threonylcarbamoyladenylate synthase [bacterium]